MADPAPAMKWWGWGNSAERSELQPHALDFLRAELDLSGERRAPVALEEVRLRDAALPRKAQPKLALAVGHDWVRDDRLSRITHTAGKGYADLVRLRGGDATSA